MTRLKTYENDANTLFFDLYTFETTQSDVSRTIMGILEVLGNVGGVQQVLLVILNFLIKRFSELSFYISVINFMFLVKTEDSSLDF